MLCHAYAFLPSSTNSGGTAWWAPSDSLSAANSCSSSQMSGKPPTSGFAGPCAIDFVVTRLAVTEAPAAAAPEAPAAAPAAAPASSGPGTDAPMPQMGESIIEGTITKHTG